MIECLAVGAGGFVGVALTYMGVSLVLGILAVYIAQRLFGA